MKENRIEAIERELWLMEFKEHWTPKDWARRRGERLIPGISQLSTHTPMLIVLRKN